MLRACFAIAMGVAITAAPLTAQSLDFEFFRTKVEPIFLRQREPGTACFACHTVMATRLRLQPLATGSQSWSEEQSRLNFEAAARLVTPGKPLSSRLLLHPLAPQAGGESEPHTGGKLWNSQQDPEWLTLAEWARTGSGGSAPKAETPTLDFGFYRARVEPIFRNKRKGTGRCVSCHSSRSIFRLEPLPAGRSEWTEEQSRKNFESASKMVVPGDPFSSRLLMHPLAPEAGGDPFHSGGRQWTSQDDPAWQALAAWVRGEAAAGSPR